MLGTDGNHRADSGDVGRTVEACGVDVVFKVHGDSLRTVELRLGRAAPGSPGRILCADGPEPAAVRVELHDTVVVDWNGYDFPVLYEAVFLIGIQPSELEAASRDRS